MPKPGCSTYPSRIHTTVYLNSVCTMQTTEPNPYYHELGSLRKLHLDRSLSLCDALRCCLRGKFCRYSLFRLFLPDARRNGERRSLQYNPTCQFNSKFVYPEVVEWRGRHSLSANAVRHFAGHFGCRVGRFWCEIAKTNETRRGDWQLPHVSLGIVASPLWSQASPSPAPENFRR